LRGVSSCNILGDFSLKRNKNLFKREMCKLLLDIHSVLYFEHKEYFLFSVFSHIEKTFVIIKIQKEYKTFFFGMHVETIK